MGANTSANGQDLKLTVTIQVTFSSVIQRDVAMRVLHQFLKAWRENVESAHEANKVTITAGS